ncbi:SDR family NAD(P)-dependent oxidoreductase [Bradyrhizobium sp. BWA-3-5]|uniref:SDR family NAD(P)-dependent oxidoreductase n=1 Tax=Bradyrhizobium sp. BWA-3-5 TaxID=3080013 RepID=UPI00293F073F|nr:SDR family NAD(P)-dependent oxidoreductase [Bradyrhizobium sp. BWA-3-5]WOH67855.1 SDR family NAD(P)-dependent oxidoreductase [Bradyrhizobium sp. BWA-3-5]
MLTSGASGAPKIVGHTPDGFAGAIIAERSCAIRLNGLSPIVLIKYVVRHMMADGAGRVVNISSIFASTGYNGLFAYAASKAAAAGFTRSLARELGGLGITLNAIAPDFIDNELTGSLDDDGCRRIASRTAMRRLPSPTTSLPWSSISSEKGGRNINGTGGGRRQHGLTAATAACHTASLRLRGPLNRSWLLQTPAASRAAESAGFGNDIDSVPDFLIGCYVFLSAFQPTCGGC